MYLFYTPDIERFQFLSEEESGHCVRVLRYSTGDEILLTDGRGTTYKAVITNPNPRRCEFRILSQEKQKSTPEKAWTIYQIGTSPLLRAHNRDKVRIAQIHLFV